EHTATTTGARTACCGGSSSRVIVRASSERGTATLATGSGALLRGDEDPPGREQAIIHVARAALAPPAIRRRWGESEPPLALALVHTDLDLRADVAEAPHHVRGACGLPGHDE